MSKRSTVESAGVVTGGEVAAVIRELRALAIRALKRMYRPTERLFAFRLRREGGQDVLEGISPRYTAIVLIALAGEDEAVGAEVLSGHRPRDVCDRLIGQTAGTNDLGAVALTLWASRALDHPGAAEVLEQLRSMEPDRRAHPTVEVAWSLSAQAVSGNDATDDELARRIAERLIASINQRSGLFPHWPKRAAPSRLRSHVGCYADLVYPIQALSYYHRAVGCPFALDAALRCADRMCDLQGPQGQWWWHYDVRTGRVVERFPVYAIHQDAMGPMALFALEDAGGGEHHDAVRRSLAWLTDPPESSGSLIDREADVIWRKVGRHEPAKLTRSVQAMASRVHPRLRAPAMDVLFRPGRVDYETRPYHMGWLLHAFSGNRAGGF